MVRWITVGLTLAVIGAAEAQESDPKKLMATALNLNGLLCAEVLDVTPLKLAGKLEVTCIEFRGGRGTVRHIYDLNTGKAFKAN